VPSAIQIYNGALSRIGISQFIESQDETSQAGNFYRLWYDTCRQAVLRDFPWNFSTTTVALALLDGDPLPGWQFKYAVPTDCLFARMICDSSGVRTYFSNVFDTTWDAMSAFPPYGPTAPLGALQQPMPFLLMREAVTATTARKVLVTDLESAYLIYTADVTDTGSMDAGFVDALQWKIATEIAAPFLGAPTGPQVATTAGKYYRDAVLTARAQSMNEAGADYRAPSPAITARY